MTRVELIHGVRIAPPQGQAACRVLRRRLFSANTLDLSHVRAIDRVLAGVFFGLLTAVTSTLSLELSGVRSLHDRAGSVSTRNSIHDPALLSLAEDNATTQHIAEIIRRTDARIGVSTSIALAKTIVEESRASNYDPFFVAAVIKAESTFRDSAISNRGARGLMQILPSTGQYISAQRSFGWQGAHQLRDPAYNIRLGIAYLRYLEDKYAFDQEQMLIAYNWGPNNLSSALRRGTSVPRSSKNYARSILDTHKKWRSDFGSRAAVLAFNDTALNDTALSLG